MVDDHKNQDNKKPSGLKKWTKVGLFVILFDVVASVVFIIWKGDFIVKGILG